MSWIEAIWFLLSNALLAPAPLAFLYGSFSTVCGCGNCCPVCEANGQPSASAQVKVVVSGVVNNSCADCDQYNQTYYLNLNQVLNPQLVSTNQVCSWGMQFENPQCPYRVTPAFQIEEIVCILSNTSLQVLFIDTSATGINFTPGLRFSRLNPPYPCGSWEDLDLPTAPVSGVTACNQSGATCLVTSVPIV